MDEYSNRKRYNICLLGEQRVGKTNIMSQFVKKIFQEDYNETIGVDFDKATIALDNKTIANLVIWDTSGLEKYRAITKVFLKESKAIILVYDITRKKTFDELKNYWIHQVREVNDKNIILAIVANKYELTENEVNEEDVLNFAGKINAMFLHTSAKKGMGINELFCKIVRKIIEKERKL